MLPRNFSGSIKNKYYFVQGHAQNILYLSDYRTIKVSQKHFGFLKSKKRQGHKNLIPLNYKERMALFALLW